MRTCCRAYLHASNRMRLSARLVIPCDVSGASIEKPRLSEIAMTTFPRFVLPVLLAGAAVTQAQEMKRYTIEGDEFSVLLPKLPAMTTTEVPRKRDRKYQVQR